jgi:hypothetical protein
MITLFLSQELFSNDPFKSSVVTQKVPAGLCKMEFDRRRLKKARALIVSLSIVRKLTKELNGFRFAPASLSSTWFSRSSFPTQFLGLSFSHQSSLCDEFPPSGLFRD